MAEKIAPSSQGQACCCLGNRVQWLTYCAKLTLAAYSYELKINLVKEYPSRVEDLYLAYKMKPNYKAVSQQVRVLCLVTALPIATGC